MKPDIEKENKARPYLTTLTPLRGIAAIFVVMHHSSLFFGPFVPSTLAIFFENSWIWVDFFFILSGFILSYSYGAYFNNRVTFTAYKEYIGARFARIYPLHFTTLLWAFIVAVAIICMATSINASIADLLNLKALLPCLLLIQDLHLYRASPLNFPSWSLSAEWWMYLVFPFLVPLFSKPAKLRTLFLLLLIITTYLVLRYVLSPISSTASDGQPTIDVVADFGLLRCIAGFCLGMLLFVFYEAGSAYIILKNSWCFILFFLVTLFAICASMTDILVIALFPFVLVTAAYNQTAIKKILSTTILQRLGDWSFSIYMVHGPIILMLSAISVYRHPDLYANLPSPASSTAEVVRAPSLMHYKTSLLYCVVLLTATLAVSAFTYRFIEIPGRKYLKGIFKT